MYTEPDISITVIPARSASEKRNLRLWMSLYWAVLLVSLWATKNYLGGSWVIEMIILIVLVMTLVRLFMQGVDRYRASLTKAEVREWVMAGCPEEVQEWHAQRKTTEK